ncbi:MAG: hypothetical protein GY719_10010 [bacterium]|nr:hypothetical protein [bacterium]
MLTRPRVFAVLILADLADGALLERAFDWLCRRRRQYPADTGVWTLRRRWGEEIRRPTVLEVGRRPAWWAKAHPTSLRRGPEDLRPRTAVPAADDGAQRAVLGPPAGISRGCPLSPLMGAFFLHEADGAPGAASELSEELAVVTEVEV